MRYILQNLKNFNESHTNNYYLLSFTNNNKIMLRKTETIGFNFIRKNLNLLFNMIVR
jgi:hypothetical protein